METRNGSSLFFFFSFLKSDPTGQISPTCSLSCALNESTCAAERNCTREDNYNPLSHATNRESCWGAAIASPGNQVTEVLANAPKSCAPRYGMFNHTNLHTQIVARKLCTCKFDWHILTISFENTALRVIVVTGVDVHI